MNVPEIDVDELEDAIAQGVIVVDVREPDEYYIGRVPGSRLIPLAEVPGRMGEIPTNSKVYMICAKGARSLAAAEFLRVAGVDAVNIRGGVAAWVAAGKSIQSGE